MSYVYVIRHAKQKKVLVYFAGWGDGKSFLTQYNEVVTIQEVWDRFDAVGVVGKPRVLVVMKTRALYFITRALSFITRALYFIRRALNFKKRSHTFAF